MFVRSFGIGAIALALSAASALAQQYDRRWSDGGRDQWESLGTQSVGFQRSIVRPRFEGERYETIVLVARDGQIFVKAVDVVFESGDRQHFQIDDTLHAGERSRPLRIEGFERGGRRVRDIELIYSAAAGTGTLEVFAERRGRGGSRPGREEWTQLACERVQFFNDTDAIQLPPNESRFRAIRLRVEGATVDVRRVRVVFGSGDSKDNWPAMVLRAGEHSPPLVLGDDRARRVSRIELNYATRPSLRGEARACIEGLH